MSQTQQSLKKGDYAYAAHSLLLSGDVIDVFVGRWITTDESTRILQKFPPEKKVDEGQLMCVLKLRRPITLNEYREVHHPAIRPLVKSVGEDVNMVLMAAEMACTFPDGL